MKSNLRTKKSVGTWPVTLSKAITALVIGTLVSSPATVRAQATVPSSVAMPSATGSQASPNNLVTDSAVEVSRRHLRPGQTVRVTLTLRNQGSGPLVSQGPSPHTVYSQDQSFTEKGLNPVAPGKYSVVMTLSGPRGNQWPYRWGIGSALPMGKSRRVSFPLRLDKPGLYTLYVGVAAGNQVRELSLGQIGLEVAPRGQKFTLGSSGPIGTPPPTRITVNGKDVHTDQRPVYYKTLPGKVSLQPEIMVPMRFVSEALGGAGTVDVCGAHRRYSSGRKPPGTARKLRVAAREWQNRSLASPASDRRRQNNGAT